MDIIKQELKEQRNILDDHEKKIDFFVRAHGPGRSKPLRAAQLP